MLDKANQTKTIPIHFWCFAVQFAIPLGNVGWVWRATPIQNEVWNSLKIAMMHLGSCTLTLWISLDDSITFYNRCTLVTSCGESHIPMAKRQHGKVTSGSGKSHQKRTNKVAQHVSSLQYKYWKWLQYQNQALSRHTAPKPWNNTSIKSHGDLKRTASRYDFLQADIT